jgi:hypothetical protein
MHEGQTAVTCCGRGGAWSKEGGPLLAGCALCRESPSHWRTNRDGGPYEPTTVEQSYASVAEQP